MTDTLTVHNREELGPDQSHEFALQAVRAQHRLAGFCQWVNPRFLVPPHIELACDALDALEQGRIDRLMVLMPPRHGKSELASRRFPAYAMGRDPTRRIILGTYGAALSRRLARACRNTMKMDRYRQIFPETQLAGDLTAMHEFDTTANGGMLAVGVDGAVTGSGGDIIILDDTIKNREEAESEAYRDRAGEWYADDIYTRLEPGGKMAVIGTPWHEDGLQGRILEAEGTIEEGGQWHVIKLPAVAEEDDVLGREPGAPLWPERFDAEALARIEDVLSVRAWAALYQQRPAPAEGLLFKHFPRYGDDEAIPHTILIPIDSAVTGGDTSDYWAWTAWGLRGPNIDWLEADRIKATPPDAEKALFEFVVRMMTLYPSSRVIPLVRQAVAIDRVAAAHLRAKKIPVNEVPLPSMGGKHVKEGLAGMIVDLPQAGLMRFPRHAPNLDAFIEEHKSFPAGADDHWVENTILAGHAFRNQLYPKPDQAAARRRYAQQGITA